MKLIVKGKNRGEIREFDYIKDAELVSRNINTAAFVLNMSAEAVRKKLRKGCTVETQNLILWNSK